MDPAPPTTHVHHDVLGSLVVVAAPMPGSDVQAKVLEETYSPGTWCITIFAHKRALRQMDENGVSQVSGDDFKWAPWKELTRKAP